MGKRKILLFSFFTIIVVVITIAISLTMTNKEVDPEKSEASSLNNRSLSIASVVNQVGIGNIYTSDFGKPLSFDATIEQADSGVYKLLNSDSIDRYEIHFNETLYDIYGIGMMEVTDSVALPDFTDLAFSSGHYSNPKINKYEGDVARMKTPIFVIPEKNIILIYKQNSVKQLRLTRNVSGTTIVFKKHPDEISKPNGELVIIRGNNIEDTYSKYYKYLSNSGYFFKKPNYKVFGLYWETFDQFGCSPTLNGVKNIIGKYESKSLIPSLITIGSGYWDTNDLSGCGGDYSDQRNSTTDTLRLSQHRIGTLDQFNTFIQELNRKGSSLMIGMRYNVYASQNNINSFTSKFPSDIQNNVFLDNQVYLGHPPNDTVRVMNLKNEEVIESHFNLVQKNYGMVNGFKEDEMFIHDQIGFRKSNGNHMPGITNFDPSLVSNTYRKYSEITNNDFIVIGRNDYFGVGTDAQNSQGYISGKPNEREYDIKFLLDSTFTSILSGYPHPVLETSIYPCKDGGKGDEKESLRTLQLQTFSAITMHSCDYSQLINQQYVNTINWYTKLRFRLHKYAYDKAMDWYSTGIPTLVRPLIMDNDFQNDKNIKSLYSKAERETSSNPKNEFMFGNALLVRPVMNQNDNVKVYLPSGNWRTFIKQSQSMQGQKFIDYSIDGGLDYPVFLKDGEILIIGDFQNPNNLLAYVSLDHVSKSNEYKFYDVDNQNTRPSYKSLVAEKINNKVYLINTTNNKRTEMKLDSFGKGFHIAELKSLIN